MKLDTRTGARRVDTSAPSIPLIVELAVVIWVVFAIAAAVALF